MLMKLKVIIADDERLICDMLSHLIDTEELQLDIVGISYDGDDLLNKIIDIGPDIVITDISMPKIDGIEIIRRAAQMEIKCKFIIISGYRQFEYAYNALKYDVVDYLLKPVDQDELNAALSKIAWQIRHNSDEVSSGMGQPAKNYFISEGIKQFLVNPTSLKEINATYNTKFEKGYFQVLIMRMDYTKKLEEIPKNANSLHNKVKNIIKQSLKKYCHELIVTNDWDDFVAVLNYSEENKELVHNSFSELFIHSKNIIELFGGLTATLCVGRIYMDICDLEKSKMDATIAAWTRMSLGIGKVIYFDERYNKKSISLNATILDMENRISTAFETLNKKEYLKCINEIFSLPNEILCRYEIRSFVKSIPDMFFDFYKDKISAFENYESIRKEVRYKIRMVTTFYDLKQTLVVQLSELIDQIKSYLNSLNTKPIRQAIDFVKKNYKQPISLEDVASDIGLSAVYFSSIFKKEMNQNFTDYLREYRLNIAKNLLANSNMSIKEIAKSLSFDDARYFSKLFKKTVGIRPTEYRRIYA